LSLRYRPGAPEPAPELLAVEAKCSYLLSVSSDGGAIGKGMLEARLVNERTIQVSVKPLGLAPGGYQGKIVLDPRPFASSPIVTVTVSLTVETLKDLPIIRNGGVRNSASLTQEIAPGSWFSVFGENLAQTTRAWKPDDFQGIRLPLSLEGVSVLVNNRPASVQYVSPSQINAQAPEDNHQGVVAVRVLNQRGLSESAYVTLQRYAPGFFSVSRAGRTYAAALHADGASIENPSRPVHSGEPAVLFGTGFGPVRTGPLAGALLAGPEPLSQPEALAVWIGGLPTEVIFAGLVGPGLYQVNLFVPALPEGDHEVLASIHGAHTPARVFLPVGR
jgi:uncharacterized protein (TIGR03437 family)